MTQCKKEDKVLSRSTSRANLQVILKLKKNKINEENAIFEVSLGANFHFPIGPGKIVA